MTPVTVTRGDSPLVLGFPHTGTHVPDAIRARLNDEGALLRDTDWHIHQLYGGLIDGATMVRASVSAAISRQAPRSAAAGSM